MNLCLASKSPPPRPPLPSDEELLASAAPPRPPLPTLDATDEETYDRDLPIPQSNQPILVRGHRSIISIGVWNASRWLLMIFIWTSSNIQVTRTIWLLWQRKWLISLLIWVFWCGRSSIRIDGTWLILFLSDLFSGETGTKRDLISTSRELADMSEHLTYLAKQLASECMDRRMRTVSTIEWHRSKSFLLICSESSASQWTHSNHRHSAEDLIDSEGDDVWNLR